MTSARVRLAASGLIRPFCQQLVHLGVHVAHALVHAGLVDVRHHHRHLELAGEEQGQLAGHQAGTHDADLGHRAGELAVRGAGGALGPALHEVQEGVDGGAELVGLHEVREGLAFQLRGLGLRQRAVGFHHLQDLGRCGGGVGGLGLHEGPARGDGAGPAGGDLRIGGVDGVGALGRHGAGDDLRGPRDGLLDEVRRLEHGVRHAQLERPAAR